MRPCLIVGGIMVLLGLFGQAAGVSAQLADSPWPMYQHDPQHTGRSPYLGPDKPAVRWRYEPVQMGSLLGPSIAPDGTAYFTSSRLTALGGNSGAVKWIHSQVARFVGSSIPAIDSEGTLYVGSNSGGKYDPNALYAVSPAGSVLWGFSVDGLDLVLPDTSARIDTSPTIGPDGAIYFGATNGKLYALNPDGTERWSFASGARIDRSSPALGPDGTVYFGSRDGNLYAVRQDGSENWRFQTGESITASPAVAGDGTVFISSGSTVFAISPTGAEKWRWQSRDFGFSPGTAAVGADGGPFVASSAGGLYAFTAEGTLKWRFSTGGGFAAPVIDAAGVVYAGSRDDHVYAVNPDGSEKWRVDVAGDVDRALAIGDGGLYFTTNNPTGKDYGILIGKGGGPSFRLTTDASGVVLAVLLVVGGIVLYLTRPR